VIPDITIKITMRPDEVTISHGQSEVLEETFTIPPVPDDPAVVLGNEQFVPPVADEESLMYSEDQYLAPPVEEVDIYSGDQYLKPPEAEEDISDRASDDVPDLPIGE
jgi:hypothetical protein